MIRPCAHDARVSSVMWPLPLHACGPGHVYSPVWESEAAMPAHFTHIYAARRVADYLFAGNVPEWPGGAVGAGIAYDPVTCGRIMKKWEKYTATGAIGPDLFYFSQDYGSDPLTKLSDDIMLALAVYFFYNSAKDENWEPLLKILDDVDSTVGKIVRFIIKLMKLWHEFVATWESTLGPFVEAAGTALDD